MIDFATKKYIILDLDGTLYAGSHLFPYTVDFLKTIRATGRVPVFLTNNSSKSRAGYFEKLSGLGIAENIDEIYTSGTATVEYLRAKGLTDIYLMATPSMASEFTDAGITLTEANPQAVVLTFDTTFNYDKFCIAHDFITAGVPFYATHPDKHVPLENGIMHPDIGTFISAFRTSTGKDPFIVGKPEKHIYEQLREHLKCEKEQMVMIGDRLNTDILGANDYGIDTILVLSGETTPEMLEAVKSAAPESGQENGVGQIPTIVSENVGELIKDLNGTL